MDKAEVVNMCICPNCPSWISCGKEDEGFCHNSIGKSKCIKEKKGCICGGCPVKKEMGLKHMYYCVNGSEKEQSK